MSIESSLWYTLDDENNAVPCTLNEWGSLYRDREGKERRIVSLFWDL